ncbi:putative ribonuclease H-like domain-containing protein, partial [Tanacetum coccineum]
PSDLGNNVTSPGIFSSTSYDDEFGADLNNLASTVEVNPVATKRINTVHPQSLIIREPNSSVQTRSQVHKKTTGETTFLGKYAIGTKWILKNKRDARGIVVRNKARLVAQGNKQEEGIDYDEVFAPVARIEAIRLFLAFTSYMGFMVYQMDVKSAFLYGSIDEEHKRDIILVQVYVDDIIFGSTKKAWCDEFEALMKGEFEMSAMRELIFFLGLQVQQRPDGIFISQDKYVQEILKKFDLESVRTATTPYEAPKPKSNNEPDNPVNVHLYRSMIGSLMYLTALRPDIMFAVSAYSRNQVTPTTSNLEAVKKIFKYLKGQPKLGLWYPRESPFVLKAYSDSDYAGANKDRKSTTGGCQFLGRRLILWQCKKQIIVATSPTEAEYVAAANCCGQTNGSRGLSVLHTGSSSVPSGVTRVPTGSFHFSYWSPELGLLAILATIDATPYTITEDSVRGQLQLADDGGYDDFFEHGQSLDPDIASFSQVQETNDALSLPTNVDAWETLWEVISMHFHKFLHCAESKFVSNLAQGTQEAISGCGGKVVVSDSDKEDGGEQDVDLDALHALANATKGKGVAVEEPTLTQDSDFLSKLEKKGQVWEKRTTRGSVPAANYSDAAWDIILARLQANPDLSSTIFGVDFTDDDFATRMVALVNSRRKELAEQRAQERRDRPMTPAQLRQYMRTYVKNQGPAVYSTGWTMAQVRKLSPEQLQEEFDKIQRAVAFTRGLKRDGSPMTRASSKKLKTDDVAVDVEAPSHSVAQEVEGEAPSQDVSREEVDAPSHSQDIPEAQVEVPSQEPTAEDVPKAQQTAPSLKKVGTKKKLLGRKGVHTSQSTIPTEEGDPDAEHKLCIKYASDEDSASDCDIPVYLYAVVDWELLPTGLGSINAIYRLDNSRKYFTNKKAEGVGLVLWGDLQILMDSPEVNDGSDFWKNQHTWSIQSWKLYSFSGVHVLETVSGLVIHMFVDKKYPLSIQLIERMLNHQLEICHETVGNELTTAVQLIAFLKKQISDSKRPKVHEWVINSPYYHNKELASPEQTATVKDI